MAAGTHNAEGRPFQPVRSSLLRDMSAASEDPVTASARRAAATVPKPRGSDAPHAIPLVSYATSTANRAAFGRTKAEREAARAVEQRRDSLLDGAKRDD